MGAFYLNFDRAQKFDVSIGEDRRDSSLRTLNIKGFDSLSLTFKPEQLKQIAEAIAKETGDVPF